MSDTPTPPLKRWHVHVPGHPQLPAEVVCAKGQKEAIERYREAVGVDKLPGLPLVEKVSHPEHLVQKAKPNEPVQQPPA